MELQYFPTQYGSLILDPKTLEGITFSETEVSQISLFNAGGVPLHITNNPHTRASKPYHHGTIDKRIWKRLNNYVITEQETKAKEIIEQIKRQAENTPQFTQESNDTHHRKEYQIINSAAQ